MLPRPLLLAATAILTLTACLPQGQRLPQSPFLAIFEPRSGQIAFIGVDGNVHVVDQAGREPRQLTEDADVESEARRVLYRTPTWSLASDRLAVLRHAFDGEALAVSSVVVLNVATGERTSVYESPVEHPIYVSWSPAGDHLSLLTGQATASRYVLWDVPVDGGEPHVVDAGRPAYWTWTPDGSAILTHIGGSQAENPGQARLSLLRLGEPVTEYGLEIEPFHFQAPALSPQGDRLLVASDGGQAPALMMTTPFGEPIAEIAALDGPVAFGWSPTGGHAAFIASEAPDGSLLGRLQLVDLADPHAPVTTTVGDDLVSAFDWSPDGRRLLSYAPVLMEAEEGGEPTLLLRLNVTEVGSGETRRLGTFRPTEAFVGLLPFFDQYAQSATAWSPDGRNIVFTAVTDDGTPAAFVMSASGTVEPRGVVEGVYAVWSWR